MERENCSSIRSGGDALKQRDGCSSLLQCRNEKFYNHSLNAANGMIKVDRHGAAQLGWLEKVASCPVYYPTDDEFTDPLRYIQKIAPEASEYGICKVVPPVVACVPAGVVLTKEQSNFKFTSMIQPMRLANWDKEDKNTFYMSGCYYTLAEYEKVANKEFARKFSTAAALPAKFIEAEFWKELVSGKMCSVEYANDVEGSAFSNSCMDPLGQSKWNLKKISRLPESILRLSNVMIPGVTEPMLYIGMLFSMFAWHVEDHYLYSINYHHCGAPKTWYGVPGKSAQDFESTVEKHVYQAELLNVSGKGSHYDLLLQKTTMFAPKLLSEHGVPVFRATQSPGEFVITFPRAYHAGFSHGFNCGEAVNFAMADWFPFGAAACSRYEFFNRMPLLPHEELLCKEAMLVSPEGSSPCDTQIYKQRNHVKTAFVSLMRCQLQAHEDIKKRGAKLVTSSFANVFCGLCKHACYVAYTSCSCYPEPTCLNHDRFLGRCTCGSHRSLVVRDDLPKLQAIAQMYELEIDISNEAMKGQLVFDAFVAHAGIGIGEEEFLNRSTPKAGDVVYEASLRGEKRPYSCEGESVAQAKAARNGAPLDSKEPQEDSSDSEAFRVKRRRASHSCSKRFQVDEQDVELLIDMKRHVDSKSYLKEKDTELCSVYVRDVMNKLGIQGSKVEVIRRWQHCARRRGLTIRTKWVLSGGRLVETLPFKSCMALKQLLKKDHAWRLEMLMQQASQTLNPMANPICGTLGNVKPELTADSSQKDFSDGRNDYKSLNKYKQKMLQDRVSEDNASNSTVGLVAEDACFDEKCHSKWSNFDNVPSKGNMHLEKSLGLVEEKKDFDQKQFFMGNIRNDRMLGNSSKHPSRDTSFLEGSLKYAEPYRRKGAQAVGRLKIKYPTLPVPAEKTCVPSSIEDDALCGGFDKQKQLHSIKRYVADETTEKRLRKEQGKGRSHVIDEADPRKTASHSCSKKAGQERGTGFSGNVYKKRGRESDVNGRKALPLYAGLACPKEPISDSSGADSSLDYQRVDPSKNSGASSHLPMAMTFSYIKDPDTGLRSISEGEVSDMRGCVGTEDVNDLLSQKVERKPDKLTLKLSLRKSS